MTHRTDQDTWSACMQTHPTRGLWSAVSWRAAIWHCWLRINTSIRNSRPSFEVRLWVL